VEATRERGLKASRGCGAGASRECCLKASRECGGIKGVLPEGIVALRRPGIIKGGWSGGNNAEASSRE